MKRLIVLSVLSLCGLVNAAEVLYAPNSLGGRIVLTKDACEAKSYSRLRHAYSTSARNGRVKHGCYGVDTRYNTVEVVWLVEGRSERSSYPLDHFVVGNF